MELQPHEDSEVAAALAGTWSRAAQPELGEPVMRRVQRLSGTGPVTALQDVRPAAPSGDRMAAAVQLRVRGISSQRKPPARYMAANRGPAWAIAAGLVLAVGATVAVMWTSGRGDTDPNLPITAGGAQSRGAPDGTDPEEPVGALWSDSDSERLAEARRLMTGQIRAPIISEAGGTTWVISKGVVEGVRIGDTFHWAPHGTPDLPGASQFRVIGVGRYDAIVEMSESLESPRTADWVWPAVVTERMIESLRRLAARDGAELLLLGPGMLLRETREGILVGEVIAEYWPMDGRPAEPTQAATLGLRAGDVLVGMWGEQVATLSELERVAATHARSALWAEVIRDGERLTLGR